MPRRVAKSFYRDFVLLNRLLSPLLDAFHQSPPDIGTSSDTAWAEFLRNLNARFTLYIMYSVMLIGISGSLTFLINIPASSAWIVVFIVRLATLQAFLAKVLALVMKTHIRELRTMQVAVVGASWLQVPPSKASLLLQAPVAAMIHSIALLVVAIVVCLALSPDMTFSAATASNNTVALTFPTWVRIAFAVLFFLEAIHCAIVSYSFFKLGVPRQADLEVGTPRPETAPPTSS